MSFKTKFIKYFRWLISFVTFFVALFGMELADLPFVLPEEYYLQECIGRILLAGVIALFVAFFALRSYLSEKYQKMILEYGIAERALNIRSISEIYKDGSATHQVRIKTLNLLKNRWSHEFSSLSELPETAEEKERRKTEIVIEKILWSLPGWTKKEKIESSQLRRDVLKCYRWRSLVILKEPMKEGDVITLQQTQQYPPNTMKLTEEDHSFWTVIHPTDELELIIYLPHDLKLSSEKMCEGKVRGLTTKEEPLTAVQMDLAPPAYEGEKVVKSLKTGKRTKVKVITWRIPHPLPDHTYMLWYYSLGF